MVMLARSLSQSSQITESTAESSRKFARCEGQNDLVSPVPEACDDQENTIRFWQEIFNENGLLVELHEKYPIDLGHQRQVEQDS